MIFLTAPQDFTPKFEVVSCFCEFNGEFLLLKRQLHKTEGGKWGVPAGKIDEGEEPSGAMLRELEEETGFHAKLKELQYLQKVFVRFPDYDFVYYMFLFEMDEKKHVVISEREHTKYMWVTSKEALKMELVTDLDSCIKLHYKS